MAFRTLGLCLLLFSALAYAQGRKPAVEDFVGIEVEESQVAPQGTESLFNLEQDIHRIEEERKKPVQRQAQIASEEKSFAVTTIFTIAFFLGLPIILWLMVMSHLKKKAKVENASNIEVLEKYRKEREKKSSEDIRKAS